MLPSGVLQRNGKARRLGNVVPTAGQKGQAQENNEKSEKGTEHSRRFWFAAKVQKKRAEQKGTARFLSRVGSVDMRTCCVK